MIVLLSLSTEKTVMLCGGKITTGVAENDGLCLPPGLYRLLYDTRITSGLNASIQYGTAFILLCNELRLLFGRQKGHQARKSRSSGI